ncbi:DUF2061 domain-containing protein [Parapontixanthobacter aurantiacus]|nr:DUF2061 domain-containing protein [Parapontixanthobacter aurantiacus]
MSHSPASCFKITCMKTASYALMHLVVAIAVAYALTRNWQAALAIGLIEPLVQTFAYYFHDRAWNRAGGDWNASSAEPSGLG